MGREVGLTGKFVGSTDEGQGLRGRRGGGRCYPIKRKILKILAEDFPVNWVDDRHGIDPSFSLGV